MTVPQYFNRLNSHLQAVRITVLAILTAVIAGCSDEIDRPQGGDCPEGLPATISVSIDTGEMTRLSRGDMQEGLDRQVNSLWVAAYNVATGARTGMLELKEEYGFKDHELRQIDLTTLSGESYLVAVANYDYRFASVDNTGELIPLPDALVRADTWDKFKAIAVAFDQRGQMNTQAPLNALVMSGFYTESRHTDGSRPEPATIAIRPGMSNPAGAIHLRRIISQVRFNVTINDKNVESFTLDSWQVHNVPTHSWLLERDDEAPVNSPDDRTAAGTTYLPSDRMTDISVSGNRFSFDFWQIENKRTGRDPGPGYNVANAYSYREKEYKNPDGTNSGRFVSLVDGADSDDPANNATYVVFHVTMEMKVDQNGTPISKTDIKKRLVETDYVVHLGFVEGDGIGRATDFNCRRNSKYTYNVTINNINDVLVEASADGQEKNPAVEGFISDITDRYYDLDAHYSAFNIYLSQTEINDFQFYINAYDLNGTELTINSMTPATVPAKDSPDYRYMNWIELRPTTRSTVLAEYRPRTGAYADGKTYTLDEIRSRGLSAGYYTVFVNEYVYEDSDNGDESKSINWHGYVNRPERRAWLNVQASVSTDKQSIYYKSKYAISQKSIQCYYNDRSASGLGVEHDNESFGLALRNTFNPYRKPNSSTPLNVRNTPGRNAFAGRYNLAQFIAGSTGTTLSWSDGTYSWSSFLNVTTPQTVNAVNNNGVVRAARTEDDPVPLPEIISRTSTYLPEYSPLETYDPNYYSASGSVVSSRDRKYIEAINACMNRNRDLNGNGKIDAGELRWFVPTTAQYVRIVLGRRSLEAPLFDPTGMTRLPHTSSNDANGHLMFYTSDGKQMWLMEGTSDSQYREWPGSVSAPWEVRCARNLGSNQSYIQSDAANTPAFERRKGTNIIDMLYYDPKSIREEPFHSAASPMPVHHINDQRYNRTYRSFEFFDSVIPLTDPRLKIAGTRIEWASYLSKTNPCRILDYTGKKGWRVPNQKEATILGVVGVYNYNSAGTTYQLTCSYSFFDNSGYVPGANPNDPDGTVNSVYRKVMKLASTDGRMTQGGDQLNSAVPSASYGFRCVRDVD